MDQQNNTKTNQQAGQTAHIVIAHAMAVIDPPVPWLTSELGYLQTEWIQAGELGHDATTSMHELWSPDHRGRAGIPAGLVPRVVGLLEQRGYAVTINDLREFGPEHQPDPMAFLGARADDRRFLIAASDAEGQIQVRGDRDAAYRIAQLCELFPRARILVVAASRGHARWLRRHLARRLGIRVALAFYRSHDPAARIIISTPLMVGRYSPGGVHLIILANARDAAGINFQQAVAYLSHHATRRYALVRAGGRQRPGDALRVEAMTGPIIYRPEAPCATVDVLVCRAILVPTPEKMDPLTRKRKETWHNERQNRLIAQSARAFHRRDLVSLMDLGLMTAPADEEWLEHGGEIKIQILVESTEHARELARKLPEWSVLSMATPIPARSPEDHSRRNAIVTLTYAATHGIAADVLIRGDAGTTAMDLPGFPAAAPAARAGRAYLIDIDHADPTDRRDSNELRCRLRDYQSRGWIVRDRPGEITRRQHDVHHAAECPTALYPPATIQYAGSSAKPSPQCRP